MTTMIRIAELIALLRGQVEQVERNWRRDRLPPLSRDAPRPDPEAVRGAQILESVGRTLDAIGGQLRGLPVSDPGRLRARHGGDAMSRLDEADEAMLAHGGFMLALLSAGERADRGALPEPEELQREVAYLRELAQRRADLLA
ncbi:MAG: hypothetical protein ACRYHQ_32195 [Janthinobacterium lividum]